jgi:hypothetical protein
MGCDTIPEINFRDFKKMEDLPKNMAIWNIQKGT